MTIEEEKEIHTLIIIGNFRLLTLFFILELKNILKMATAVETPYNGFRTCKHFNLTDSAFSKHVIIFFAKDGVHWKKNPKDIPSKSLKTFWKTKK